MKKFIFIILLTGFGIYDLPAFAMACHEEKAMQMSCCLGEHNMQKSSSNVSCHLSSSKEQKKDTDCNNDCSSACQCSISTVFSAISDSFYSKKLFVSFKPELFSFIFAGTLSGFYSIWRPPKIT